MLSLFWQITPHFEGIGAIKMVLSGFLKLRIVEESMGYVIVHTSLFSYQLHMAVSCENGGFFRTSLLGTAISRAIRARRTTSLNMVTHLDPEGCRQWLLTKAPEKTVYIRVYIIKNRIRKKPATMRY